MAKVTTRRSLAIIGLIGALTAPVAVAGDAATDFVLPGSLAASKDSCVEPTDYMRRNHMEVIKHMRDETVHGGIRGTKYSLAGCVQCHVVAAEGGAHTPVNAEGQFCAQCHEFAAVHLNCFDCHATVPNGPQQEAAAVDAPTTPPQAGEPQAPQATGGH